jgi:hypothetical protein
MVGSYRLLFVFSLSTGRRPRCRHRWTRATGSSPPASRPTGPRQGEDCTRKELKERGPVFSAVVLTGSRCFLRAYLTLFCSNYFQNESTHLKIRENPPLFHEYRTVSKEGVDSQNSRLARYYGDFSPNYFEYRLWSAYTATCTRGQCYGACGPINNSSWIWIGIRNSEERIRFRVRLLTIYQMFKEF